ncbi:MAG TPA: GAP family protein [Solirubrobacteraceae bacterium]|nr:GAP family protein [Solirubrobacteraceae bacterium]
MDIQLVLVGLVAMLEPATLASSSLALVLGDRPLRTGSWFYIGGLGATLAVGVVAALVLGNAAASPTSTPRTWVSVFGVVAGVLLLAYVARAARRPANPEAMASNIERMGKVATAPAITIVGAGALLANAGLFMVVALKDISQLNPTAGQYVLDWVLFALASMLPLGLALVMLLLAPDRTMPILAGARVWIERHARTVALILVVALAVSLLRDGISGLTS